MHYVTHTLEQGVCNPPFCKHGTVFLMGDTPMGLQLLGWVSHAVDAVAVPLQV
jgi:hypothetical protein